MHGSFGILPLKAVGLTYAAGGRVLVEGLGFEIAAGRRHVILGPNGAGKSVTLRLLHGLLSPTAGRVEWRRDPAGRHAMVFQRAVLLRRSARANLLHALSLARLGRAEREARADDALDRFGLHHLADRPAQLLSGGEQQRLAIARAFSLRPELLFLDEPTAALDPASTRAVEAMIEACHAAGVTIVMTTHDLGQAGRLADEALFLHRGRLLEAGPAAAFFAEPRSDAARAFLHGDLPW